MRWVLRIAGGLVLLVALLAAIGLLLPSHFRVERSVEIAASAEKVYGLMADPREWKRWTVWNRRDPAMKMEYAGAPSGVGARWSWVSKSEGTGSMEFTEARPGERIAYKLSFPEFGMRSSGALALAPNAGKVRVTWTNEGELGNNPINRWFGLLMDRFVGADFEGGLANLKRLAEGA
jgi:uncharacterized protein YndB with AHSA1/START domain